MCVLGNDDPMILLVKCMTLQCQEHGFIMFVFSWWTSWAILLGLSEPIQSDNQTMMILRSLNLHTFVYFPFQEKIQPIKSFIQYTKHLESFLESRPERCFNNVVRYQSPLFLYFALNFLKWKWVNIVGKGIVIFSGS